MATPLLNQTPGTSQKPSMVTAIAAMTLINGILNILYGLGLTTVVVLGTLFFGVICAPLTILPAILGIFEIIYATKLMSSVPQPVKPAQTIAILEIACVLTGNFISAVVGILALVFYNDPSVRAHFALLNNWIEPAMPVQQPAQPSQPALPSAPAVESLPEPPVSRKPAKAEKANKPKARKTKKKTS